MDLTTWFKKEKVPKPGACVPWTSLHSDVVEGVDAQKDALRGWVRDYVRMAPGTPKGAFLIGPPGSGKTRVAEVVLREFGLNIVERNASSHRTRRALEDDVQNTINAGLPNALIFEDVDSIVAGQGGVDYICQVVNPLRGTSKPITRKDRQHWALRFTIPIVCISNSATTRALTDLMSDSLVVRFEEASDSTLRRVADAILERERLELPESCLSEIVRNARGDARQFVNSLEYAARTGGLPHAIDKSLTPAKVAELLFAGPPLGVSDAIRLASCDPISVSHALQENYLSREANPDELLELSVVFSDCDVMTPNDSSFAVEYVPGIVAGAVHARISGSAGPSLNPGTSWSRKSYEAMREKQLQKARDIVGGRRSPEHVAGIAYALRRLANAQRYKEAAELASSYGLDHKGIDVVVRAVSADPLKQRHKTALKALLPASS